MVVELSPEARLKYVVICGLLMALSFIAHGAYTLVTGFHPSPGFGRRPPSARPLGPAARIWAGLLPFFIGMLILGALTVMAARRHVPPLTVAEWLRTRAGDFLGIVCLGGMGIWSLIRPETMAKWVRRSYQITLNEAEERRQLLTIRFLSAVLLGMAVLMLAIILWAPANVA